MKKVFKQIGKIALLGTFLFPLQTKAIGSSSALHDSISKIDTRKVIILDPGHGKSNQKKGVIDWGTVYKEHREADIVLEQAKKTKEMLDSSKYNVTLTRYDCITPTPIESRPKLANKLDADLFISFHVNHFELASINGFEVYYRDEKSKDLAELMAKNLEKYTPIKKRKVEKGNFKVLDSLNCCGILVEGASLSNSKDREYLLGTIPYIEQATRATIDDYFTSYSVNPFPTYIKSITTFQIPNKINYSLKTK